MTAIMGIVNVTPDSFSGDGLHGQTDTALSHIDAMIEEGVAVVDIGAQSTRPHADILTSEQEWQRLAPVLEALGERRQQVQISVDTYHTQTAQRALKAGAHIINDVSGGHDKALIDAVVEHQATLVVMHSLSVPVNPALSLRPEDNAVEVVDTWMQQTIMRLEGQGLAKDRLILDPGIGFGKSREQSFALIRHAAHFKRHGVKLLIGHSRKSFLTLFTSKPAELRDPETLAISYYLAEQGVDYLRVHDVAGHRAMLRMRAAYAAS